MDIAVEKITTRYVDLTEIDDDFVTQWRDLECRAVEANAYLSPSFVLPALKHLLPNSPVYFLVSFVEKAAEKQMCGLGVFLYSKGSVGFPLPHFVAFRTIHSYFSGILLDESCAQEAADSMFSHIKSSKPRVFGVSFFETPMDGVLGEVMHSSFEKNGAEWHLRGTTQRAYLSIRSSECGSEGWDSNISSKRRKNYRRNLKKLQDHGEIEWKLHQGENVGREHVDSFLELEDKGWKGDASSSMLSRQNNCLFFKEMVDAFAVNEKAFFSELSVGGKKIASTCNLISGGEGFAFKIGWDKDFYEYSPGVINEMQFIEKVDDSVLPVKSIDSGADEDSFINSFWKERKQLSTGIVTLGFMGSCYIKLFLGLKMLKAALIKK